MNVKLQNLFWSTRGREWGFRFFCKPTSPNINWELIYRKIFANDDSIDRRWYGRIRDSDVEYLYIASRFYDDKEEWRDASGRKIPHEMLLLMETDIATLKEWASNNWERAVMTAVREFYGKQYNQPNASNLLIDQDKPPVEVSEQDKKINSLRHDIDLNYIPPPVVDDRRGEKDLPWHELLRRKMPKQKVFIFLILIIFFIVLFSVIVSQSKSHRSDEASSSDTRTQVGEEAKKP